MSAKAVSGWEMVTAAKAKEMGLAKAEMASVKEVELAEAAWVLPWLP